MVGNTSSLTGLGANTVNTSSLTGLGANTVNTSTLTRLGANATANINSSGTGITSNFLKF